MLSRWLRAVPRTPMNDSTRAISGDGRCGAGPHLLPRHPPDTPEPEPPLAASARARSTTYPAAPPKRRSQISPNITSFGLAEVYKSRARRGKTAHHAEPCVTRWLNRYRWNPILASWKRLTSETREPHDAPRALRGPRQAHTDGCSGDVYPNGRITLRFES